MSDHKKPGWTFWVTASVAVLPVLYVLSSGPVQWMDSHGMISDFFRALLMVIYRPLRWIDRNSESFHIALKWYVSLWMP